MKYQDQLEAETLYDVLEHDVIPTFYDRGADRIPRRWVERMKSSIASLCPFVNTHRMVRDYMYGYYEPAHERSLSLLADHGARARELSAAVERLRRGWNEVRIERIERSPHSVGVASEIHIRADVHLGALSPHNVAVELYLGRVNPEGDIVDGHAITMQCEGPSESSFRFVGTTALARSGHHGFTIRVRPHHPDLPHGYLPGLICWADERKVTVMAAS